MCMPSSTRPVHPSARSCARAAASARTISTAGRASRVVARWLLVGVLLVLGAPAGADEVPWYLMDRHEGCVDLTILVRRERLSRVPASPEDFAQMMGSRGYQVAVGPVPNSPPDLAG